MKRIILFFTLLVSIGLFAQKEYNIDGTSYELKTEVEGSISLLWAIIDGEYRYFSKKGNDIRELKNTRGENGFQNEFKQVLSDHTADQNLSVDKVKLTLPSLKKFFDSYNKLADTNFIANDTSAKLRLRLGGFIGATNYPFITNLDNSIIPQVGVDFEIFDNTSFRRHAIVFQFRQLFGNDDFDINSSQFSLNYRFKFIQTDKIDVFINTKIADLVIIDGDLEQELTNGDVIVSTGQTEFQAPLAFGIGADIALGKGYITLGLYDLVAINLNSDDFPTDFVVGYKFNL